MEELTLNITSTLAHTVSGMRRGKPMGTYQEAPVSCQLRVSEERRGGRIRDAPDDVS